MAGSEAAKLVKALFQAAVDLDTEARADYLDEQCRDPAARAEVGRLLALHDETTARLAPAVEQLARIVPARKETEFAATEMLGEFRILRKLGEGGMAVVYLAEETPLERLVALKVLPSALTRSEERVARFRHEAVTVARLKHDGIVPVYRVGEARGVWYIAMEYVEGPTLEARLGEMRGGPEADLGREIRSRDYLRRQAALVAAVADALDHTHQHDVVHRDVKPSNILLDDRGRPRLTDFGIARNLRDDAATATDRLAGTYCYMSPEQARARTSEIDGRTDIFSLGIVLYEMLTLELPFRGSTPTEILSQVISKQPRRVSQHNPAVSRDLETICHKAIEKEPGHRYQTAAHLAADLRCYLADRPILARPPSVYRRARVWIRDHKYRSILVLAAALAAVVVVLAIVLVQEQRSRQAPVLIRTNLPGAVVYQRRVDPVSLEWGPRRRLGPAPLQLRVPAPGQYRFTAVGDDGRFAEATLLVDAGTPVSLDLQSPADQAGLTEGMVLIESGEVQFSHAGQTGPLAPRKIQVPAFWIDRREVSNADYLQFVEATGRARPPLWERFGNDAALMDRPVVAISLDEAQDYARWRGKRLPTAAEWERATRAPDDRLVPWGDAAPAALHAITAEGIHRMNAVDWDLGYAEYVRHTRPVGSDPQLATATGLSHAATNVSELTETILFDRTPRVVAKGAAWIDSPRYTDLAHVKTLPLINRSLTIGFRCVRSAAP